MSEQSLQDRYAPGNSCFGCGPSNEQGLQIRSFPTADDPDAEVVADWSPSKHHEAFEGILNGGIIGSLLDCHLNWTAAWHLMLKREESKPPCTVTAEYAVKLLKPTPSGRSVHLVAKVVESTQNRAVVDATLSSEGDICATCRGTFIAVKPGHPAYRAW